MKISHLFTDAKLRAIFAAAERDQGQEPVAAMRKQPKPRLSGGAVRRVRELETA